MRHQLYFWLQLNQLKCIIKHKHSKSYDIWDQPESHPAIHKVRMWWWLYRWNKVEHELKVVEISDGYMGTDNIIDFSLYTCTFLWTVFKKKIQHVRVIADAINQNKTQSNVDSDMSMTENSLYKFFLI